MKTKYIKTTAELIGLQIFFAVLSAIFSFFFSWIKNWEIFYSIFTGWLFLGAVHSTFWQMGNKDYKNNVIYNNNLDENIPKRKLSMLGGLKYGSGFFVINVLIGLFTMLFDFNIEKGLGVLALLHRIMLLPLSGFIPDVTKSYYWIGCFLLYIVMYIPCITAYISGAHNFSLTEKYVPKIIYKSKSKKD